MDRLVSFPHRFFTLAIILATTGALTGCNLADNNLSSSTEPVTYQLGTISGVVHGGNIPVAGSKVQIWATQNNGYGGNGLLLAEANSVDNNQGDGNDTNSTGAFTFSTANYAAGCPAGQQVYITSSGGNTGAGANSNLLLMAALGSCASLYNSTAGTASKTYGSGNPAIVLNEVTTATAAYALANFITISGTTVNISAPVTNNYSDGAFAWNGTAYAACSGTACNGYASFNSTTGVETTYANGLAHAFNNAVNMVNISTGQLYNYIVNGAGSTTTLGGSSGYGVVPRATLNTLANAMQTCVNSLSSTASLSTNCSSLFNATPNLSGTTPTNTLQAAINLAKNPYSNSTNVAAIQTLASAQTTLYSPYLSSPPNDWSASIVYRAGGFNVPYNLALDANDNAYTNNTGSGTSSVLVAISANGNFLYGSTGVSAVDSGGTALTLLRGLAADSNGYIYSANDINSQVASSDSGTFQFTASTGAYAGVLQHAYVASTDPIPDPDYVAVTRRNDVWTSYAVASGGNVDWWQCNGGNNTSTSCTYSAASVTGNHNSYANGAFTEISTATDAFNLGIAVDGNQNVWVADQGYVGTNNYSGTVVSELTNGNAATQSSYPVYDNSTTAGTAPYNNAKLAGTTTACGTAPYTFAFDSSNNGWFTVTTTPPSSSVATPAGYLCKATVTTTNSIPTALSISSSPISVGAGIPEALAMDGNNVLWIPLFNYDNSTTGYANYGVAAYNTTSGALQSEPVNGYTSCYVSATATGASTCTAGSTTAAVTGLLAISNPRQAAIDSAGNLWLNEPDDSTVTMTLGIAAPTVPLLSAGKFGVKP